jgi:methylated-DNA-[protein]-cysteine S-methyltransferase
MGTTELDDGPERLRALADGAEDHSAMLADGLADAAWADGLLDVAYGFVESPFGPLLVAVTPRGLVRVLYPDYETDEEVDLLAHEVSPRVLRSARATQDVRRELDEYFDGRRRAFDVPVDFEMLHGFRRAVLERTAEIPFGTVITYREMAERAGSPRGARAAGNALGSNPVPIVVPCHRVVHSGGGLGGYTGGLDRKIHLLKLEGVRA